MSQPQYAYDFSDFSVMLCLQYMLQIIECCHSFDLITISVGLTRIHHSENSEITIPWSSIRAFSDTFRKQIFFICFILIWLFNSSR